MGIDCRAAREKLLAASGIMCGRVLDVGMGSCACMSRLLAKAGFDVVGVDWSTQAVHEARRRGRGLFKAQYGDAEDLRFADGEFDAVVSYRALHHARDAEQALAEMFRVCRYGGTIMVAELSAKGRRRYDESGDAESLVQRVENYLRQEGSQVKRIDVTNDILFVCRKIQHGPMGPHRRLEHLCEHGVPR